jgi:hypothetical protein
MNKKNARKGHVCAYDAAILDASWADLDPVSRSAAWEAARVASKAAALNASRSAILDASHGAQMLTIILSALGRAEIDVSSQC